MRRPSTEDLAEAKVLAGKISDLHAKAEEAKGQHLDYAFKAGRFLDELWDLLGKGEYGKRQKELLPDVGERMCRYYREARHLYRDLELEPATIAGCDFTITGFIKWATSEAKQRKQAARTSSRLTSSGRRVSATPSPTNDRTSSGRRAPTPENSNPLVKAHRRASVAQRQEYYDWLPKHSRYKVVPQ
jgi:hypothetical protein